MLHIGWSELNITPDKKVSLHGQFAERISEYVEKPLTATALALEKDGEQAVFVSCDLAGITWNLVCAVRDRLSGNSMGLDPNKVMFNAIHTHTGPNYTMSERAVDDNTATFDKLRQTLTGFLRPGQKYIEKENVSTNPEVASEEEVFDLLVERLSRVTLDAWNNRKEGYVVSAFGRAVVGMCRRAVYSDGSAQMWGNTDTAVFSELEGGSDSGIELLYLLDAKKNLTGVVANLACPAQCVQHRMFVSPDFWGETKLLLRNHFGHNLYLLPQCSIAGDQCPVDLVRWVEPEHDLNDPNCKRENPKKRKADPSMFDLAGMRKAGKRVANEIISVYEDRLDEPMDDPIFEHRVETLQLPIRRASLSDLKHAKDGILEYLRSVEGNVDYNDLAHLQVYLGVLQRFEIQERLDCLDTETHILRLGTVAFATNPFEPFLDYGNQIKARSPAEQTFLIQLCNGSEGYIPTEKAEKGGHYSAFLSSGWIGHAGGALYVRQVLKQINQMFSE